MDSGGADWSVTFLFPAEDRPSDAVSIYCRSYSEYGEEPPTIYLSYLCSRSSKWWLDTFHSDLSFWDKRTPFLISCNNFYFKHLISLVFRSEKTVSWWSHVSLLLTSLNVCVQSFQTLSRRLKGAEMSTVISEWCWHILKWRTVKPLCATGQGCCRSFTSFMGTKKLNKLF